MSSEEWLCGSPQGEGLAPSGEAAQTPAHTISKQGLGREVRLGLRRLE